ncbi:hypothetical protein LCGC14_0359530 [marine sediment metagenome]|uniref:Uncharacterized protein n=1 Tax=marine sediment metagenome TaxID=412755 RepID=A0A0F9WGP0_9ZZZZ|nr:hypothetical protein [Candidatus Aminicenantes bacterium]
MDKIDKIFTIAGSIVIIFFGVWILMSAFNNTRVTVKFQDPETSYKNIYIQEENGDVIGGTIIGDCWWFASAKTDIRYRGCINNRNVKQALDDMMKEIPPDLK